MLYRSYCRQDNNCAYKESSTKSTSMATQLNSPVFIKRKINSMSAKEKRNIIITNIKIN